MQQYQNYFPMNNYIQQPQYTNNPYNMQRMDYLQQFQQGLQQQQQVLVQNQAFTPLGKIVESIDIVKATDIPMDGNLYYFPKADGSEIYAKQWLANGTTRIVQFKPFINEPTDVQDGSKNQNAELSDSMNNVLKRLC